jgi:hypothetical protein
MSNHVEHTKSVAGTEASPSGAVAPPLAYSTAAGVGVNALLNKQVPGLKEGVKRAAQYVVDAKDLAQATQGTADAAKAAEIVSAAKFTKGLVNGAGMAKGNAAVEAGMFVFDLAAANPEDRVKIGTVKGLSTATTVGMNMAVMSSAAATSGVVAGGVATATGAVAVALPAAVVLVPLVATYSVNRTSDEAVEAWKAAEQADKAVKYLASGDQLRQVKEQAKQLFVIAKGHSDELKKAGLATVNAEGKTEYNFATIENLEQFKNIVAAKAAGYQKAMDADNSLLRKLNPMNLYRSDDVADKAISACVNQAGTQGELKILDEAIAFNKKVQEQVPQKGLPREIAKEAISQPVVTEAPVSQPAQSGGIGGFFNNIIDFIGKIFAGIGSAVQSLFEGKSEQPAPQADNTPAPQAGNGIVASAKNEVNEQAGSNGFVPSSTPSVKPLGVNKQQQIG